MTKTLPSQFDVALAVIRDAQSDTRLGDVNAGIFNVEDFNNLARKELIQLAKDVKNATIESDLNELLDRARLCLHRYARIRLTSTHDQQVAQLREAYDDYDASYADTFSLPSLSVQGIRLQRAVDALEDDLIHHPDNMSYIAPLLKLTMRLMFYTGHIKPVTSWNVDLGFPS